VRDRKNQFEIENHCSFASNFKASKNYIKMNVETPCERKFKNEMVYPATKKGEIY
jgi:hypothetical protein